MYVVVDTCVVFLQLYSLSEERVFNISRGILLCFFILFPMGRIHDIFFPSIPCVGCIILVYGTDGFQIIELALEKCL